MVIDVDNSQIGFRLQVRVRHGATYREETAFARRLTDYLDEHEMQHSGGPLLMWLTGQDRELSSTDQIDLAFWLLRDPMCAVVRISDLGHLAGEHGFVDVEALDFCVFALTLLYSLHRVTADQVIDLLGGFMCRTDPEEGM
jgi:hypothetical protein